ncbi:MAG: DUF262 domain-containing protein [Chromatiaceae bacterium]|nr:DUF262 domain-containing protein [Chromatiaceae bacterium]MCF7993410.1 DUF262 domain-containing protein [Chromatiaceae bacterium]
MNKLGFTLLSPPEIFQENYFFVPDYQRGYAWTDSNVDDLLQDVLHLMRVTDTQIKHYTGTLVLTKPEKDSLVNRFGLVDGQQRVTTLVILMSCIAEALRSVDRQRSKLLQETYVIRGEVGNEQPVLLLGKEIQPYFSRVIIGDETKEQVPIEYNSQQALLDAKERIMKWIVNHSIADSSFLLELTASIENRLGFLVYSPEDITEVGIMFEVINNRGKELSELEKVKNYLIYCCAKLGANTTRDTVNWSWSVVLRNLRSARITNSQDESAFLRYCSVVHLKLSKSNSQNVYAWMKKAWDIDHALSASHEKSELIRLIEDFVRFMIPASMWYAALFGQKHEGIPKEIIEVLEDLRSQSAYASVMPLILAVLVKNKGSGESVIRLLRLIAILNFRVYVAQGITARSDSGQSSLYDWARSYYHDESPVLEAEIVGKVTVDNQEKYLEWGLCDFVQSYSNDEAFELSFHLPEGGNYDFYGWSGLRYFLMCYEAEIQPKKTIPIDRILLGRYDAKTNDYYSIEHVWARSNRIGTGQNNRPQDYWVKRRLGNFVLLEMGINIAAQHLDVEDRLEVYTAVEAPSDLQQVRLLVSDVKAAVEALEYERQTKNRFLDMYSSICDAQEDRFIKFAKKRWSIEEFICSDFDT